ncbi:MAG: substrate-binding domain-containing protein [Armatimonadetes bacterium]|nr:substrate-binding domain-containing protein [Armatimonadota bacterium]
MKRRSLAPLVAAALIGALLAGCSPRPASNDTGGETPAAGGSGQPAGTIGVSLLTMANPFFKVMGDSMVDAGKANGYRVIVQAGEMDPARQKDQVNDFIVKKVNAIVLSPVDSRSIGTAIRAANDANVPVFTADIASLDPSARVVSHVATDNYGGGKLAGQAMVEALNGKGKVAIITHPEVESVIQRAKGFKEVLSQSPGVRIVAELPGKGQRDTSFKVAQDILQSHPDLDGLFAINDPSALGAVAAIEQAGKAGKIKVIGFDGMPEARQAVKDGKIYADIVQHPDAIGKITMETVNKYMAGEKVPAQKLIPASTYTRADADKDPSLK